jgi:preprotein translocase subunit SecE
MNESNKKSLNPLGFIKESKEELSKVSWPSKKDVVRYSTIVVCVTVGLAAFFAVLDWALTLGLDKLIELGK